MYMKGISVFLLLLVMFSTVFAVPYAPFDEGFISDWNFNGSGTTVYDVNQTTPHNMSLVVDGGSYSSGVASKNTNFGTAYNFKSGAYVTIENHEDFRAPEFSVSMWVQPKTETDQRALFTHMANRTTSQYAGSLLYLDSGVLTWRMGSVDGSATESTMIYPGRIDNHQWHHIVITYDGTYKRMYVDGNLTGTPQTAGLAYNSATFVALGAARINGAYTWVSGDTNWDAVSFWNRALTTDEISSLWGSGNGLVYPFLTPTDFNEIARWTFNDTGPMLPSNIDDINNSAVIIDANYIDSIPGVLVNAYTFDGTSATVFDDASRFTAEKFSFSGWFQTTSSGEHAIFSSAADRTIIQYAGWWVSLENGYLKWRMGTSDGSATETTLTSSTGGYNDGDWHFVALTYDGTTKRMYIDGSLVPLTQESDLEYNVTNFVTIGGIRINGTYGSYGFDGNLDEFRFWNYDINTTDINAVFYDISGISPPTPPIPTEPVYTTFNVYRAGTTSHLNNITLDTNVSYLDLSSQTSPFSTIEYDKDTYVSATFSRVGYDDNSFSWYGDANDTYTIYLTDNTNPEIGTVTLDGFTITGAYIEGTGTITATISDLGSGIDYCQYSFIPGVWTIADRNATHCYKSGFTVVPGTNYIFNIKAVDVAGNTGIGIATSTYYANDTPPTIGDTSIIGFTVYNNWFKGTGDIISGTAQDTNSGLNVASCEYTSNDEVSWSGASWNTDHCEVIGITPNNGIPYTFNFRIENNLGIVGTGQKTITYTGDTVGPTITSNAVSTYYDVPTITLSPSDGAGSGVKQTWYCADSTNTCTPNTVGTSVVLDCLNGTICTYYIKAISMDNLDTNGALYSYGPITIDRQTPAPIPVNESNQYNWLTLTNDMSETLFGFDYTMLGIAALTLCAVVALVLKLSLLVSLMLSIPLTLGFLILSGGSSFYLAAILILEIIAFAIKVGMSILSVGKAGV